MSGIANEPRLKARITEVLPDPSVEEAWAIVLMIRHARKYCRNNSALYAHLNRMFPNLRFSTVPKTNARGETYEGLVITEKQGQKKIDKDRWESNDE